MGVGILRLHFGCTSGVYRAIAQVNGRGEENKAGLLYTRLQSKAGGVQL